MAFVKEKRLKSYERIRSAAENSRIAWMTWCSPLGRQIRQAVKNEAMKTSRWRLGRERSIVALVERRKTPWSVNSLNNLIINTNIYVFC